MSSLDYFEKQDLLAHPLTQVLAFVNLFHSVDRFPDQLPASCRKIPLQISILDFLKTNGFGTEADFLPLCEPNLSTSSKIARVYRALVPLIRTGIVRRERVVGNRPVNDRFYLTGEVSIRTELENFKKWLSTKVATTAIATALEEIAGSPTEPTPSRIVKNQILAKARTPEEVAAELGVKLKPNRADPL